MEEFLYIVGGLLIWIVIFMLIIAIIYSKYKQLKKDNAPLEMVKNLEKIAKNSDNSELLARIEKLEQTLQEQKK